MASKRRQKVALITGVTGQDGSYLAEFLLKKGYIVHAVKRRSSSFNTWRVDHLYKDHHVKGRRFFLHYGDMVDTSNLVHIVQKVQPDEIYNLAAQSHVHVSFETPEYTANADAIGPLRLLEAVRILGLEKKTKLYQASTSEMFGSTKPPQSEEGPFRPRSPYAAAKLYAHWITVNYREAYGMFAVSGILFNHESPVRGETFVTRKITRAVARISLGLEDKVYLGNLDAKRDWGHAREYAEAMWLMLQQKEPRDYVIATGKHASVRTFVEMAFKEIGISIAWKGKGLHEKGFDKKSGKVLVETDARYFRPTEVYDLLGDSSKARRELGWKPKVTLRELVREMVLADIAEAKVIALHKQNGFKTYNYYE